MTPQRAYRRTLGGIVVGVVVVLLAAAAGWFYLSSSGALTRTDNIDRVVVVFASHAEDGAEVASIVALVTDRGRSVKLLDPNQAVTIPGTSYDHLGDAYPFGGGKAVVQALGSAAGGPASFVDVAEADWIALMQRGKPVEVESPKALEVFNGKRLVSFVEGTQTVPPTDIPALLRAAAYLDAPQRMGIVDAVGEASVAALGAEGSRTRVRTDLTAVAYAKLLTGLSGR